MKRFIKGKKYLITTDDWFLAPDGKTYRGVFGKVKHIHTDGSVTIGTMTIDANKIHYAIKTKKVKRNVGETWSTHKGVAISSKTPPQIYVV